jgi:hypothetical protein
MQTFMARMGFEHTTPEFKMAKALDRAATVIGQLHVEFKYFIYYFAFRHWRLKFFGQSKILPLQLGLAAGCFVH